MQFKIANTSPKKNTIYILDNWAQSKQIKELTEQEQNFIANQSNAKMHLIQINQYHRWVFFVIKNNLNAKIPAQEAIRRTGSSLYQSIKQQSLNYIAIQNLSDIANAAYLLGEGIALSSYQFTKYFSDAEKKQKALTSIEIEKKSITQKEIDQLNIIIESVTIARNLVNEPLNNLNATTFAKQIATLGKNAGFTTISLNKTRIEKEKMGGLLAVNRGSKQPPTFNILEYKPNKLLNKQPIVLVGKGVMYDTGGLSLKPTPNSMDRMKSDMSGAALVTAAMYAIAKLKLPIHVIGLIPATDNRPGEDAYVPGDIIKMYSGNTVEVLNTDAEGRLILADALHWAKRYKPELVINFATLTGAAAAISGSEAMIYMGTAQNEIKKKIEQSGLNQYERMIELPLWPEYGDMIKSEIADLKNVGGPFGGAITAGKFLEYFTSYPWLHFDIAGVSFQTSQSNYKPTGGTGFGLRMLLDYFINYGR